MKQPRYHVLRKNHIIFEGEQLEQLPLRERGARAGPDFKVMQILSS